MNKRVWRLMCVVVAMLSLVLASGLASPASAKESDAKASCKQGGWQSLVRAADGTPFRNQGDCVSYVAADGGVPAPAATLVVTVGNLSSEGNYCILDYLVTNPPRDVLFRMVTTLNDANGESVVFGYNERTYGDSSLSFGTGIQSGETVIKVEMYVRDGDSHDDPLVGPIATASGMPMTCGG